MPNEKVWIEQASQAYSVDIEKIVLDYHDYRLYGANAAYWQISFCSDWSPSYLKQYEDKEEALTALQVFLTDVRKRTDDVFNYSSQS